MRPTPVLRLAHPRLHLFAKLEYHSGVGSLKDLKVSQLIEVPDFFWKLTR